MKLWKISLACLAVLSAPSIAQAGILENHMMAALDELARSRQPLEMSHIQRVFNTAEGIAHTEIPEVFQPKFGWAGFFNRGQFEGQRIFVHIQHGELPQEGGMLCTAYERNKTGDQALTFWEHVGEEGQVTGLMQVGTLPVTGLEGSGLRFDEKNVRALALSTEMRRRFRALGVVPSEASASGSASALVSIVDAPTAAVTMSVTALPSTPALESRPIVADTPAPPRPKTGDAHRKSSRSSEITRVSEKGAAAAAASSPSTSASSKPRSEKHRDTDAAPVQRPSREKPSRAPKDAKRK